MFSGWEFHGDSILFPDQITKYRKIFPKSEKNILEFSKSVERSTPYSDFLEEFQKVGLMAVEQYVEFLKKFTPVITNLPVGPCSNHPREAGSRHLFRSRRLEDPQADNRKPNQLTQFYSRQWHMDHGLWTLLLYFVRWVKFRIIDQQRVCTKYHPSPSPVLTNDFSRCEYARCSRLWSEQAYPVTICPIRL